MLPLGRPCSSDEGCCTKKWPHRRPGATPHHRTSREWDRPRLPHHQVVIEQRVAGTTSGRPPNRFPVRVWSPQAWSSVNTKLRGARMTFSAASMTSRSVAPFGNQRDAQWVRHLARLPNGPSSRASKVGSRDSMLSVRVLSQVAARLCDHCCPDPRRNSRTSSLSRSKPSNTAGLWAVNISCRGGEALPQPASQARRQGGH